MASWSIPPKKQPQTHNRFSPRLITAIVIKAASETHLSRHSLTASAQNSRAGTFSLHVLRGSNLKRSKIVDAPFGLLHHDVVAGSGLDDIVPQAGLVRGR